MVKVFSETISKSDLVASPVDEVLKDGIITNIEKGLLSEFVDEKYHKEFDNLGQESLLIYFEVKFNDKILKGTDRIAYYKEPMTNTKIGKFINKYGDLKVGAKINLFYNSKGFGKIQLD